MISRKFYLFFLIPFLLITSVFGQQKEAFQLKDLYAVKSVGELHVSPDGNQLVFLVTQYDFENSERQRHIWIMDADGGNLHQVTRGEKNISGLRWAPDGTSLLVVSEDSVTEQSQAYSLTLYGETEKKLTDFSMGVDSPRLSPSGHHLIFTSRIFSEAGADSDRNSRLQASMEDGPVQAHITDDLFYRHWNFWKDGKRKHTFSLDFNTGELVDLTPGNFESPRFDLGGSDGYDISPNGKELVYVSNHDPEPQSSTNGDLWIVPVEGGSAKNITVDNPAFDGHPRYSPDGRYIAYLRQDTPGYESTLFQIALYDRKSQKHTILNGDFNNWVSDFIWSPDSKGIFFYGPVEGHYPVYKLTLRNKNIQLVKDNIYTRGLDIAPDGSTLYIATTAVDRPTEIYSLKLSNNEINQLTSFNLTLRENVDFRPAESTWVESTDGEKIQLFIVKPHNFDPEKKYPLILNVHGGPQGMFGNSFRGDYQVYPGSGYVVAFSNPRGSIGYGQEFTAQISGDWGGQVYQDLMAVTDHLESLPYVDPERMGAMGWSYGGYMMNWFEGHTDRFQALASMMGVYDLRSMYSTTEELWFPEWDLKGRPWTSDLYDKWSPSNYVENFSTPCLVITGQLDFRVPYTQSLMLFNDLQVQGIDSRLIVFENDGHWPDFLKSMPLYYNVHLEWFHEFLGGDPAPYESEKMWRNRIMNW